LNQVSLYKKWAAIFAQRRDGDGSVTLYSEDQRALLDDVLSIKLFAKGSFNEN
jgi:hypothetical protein